MSFLTMSSDTTLAMSELRIVVPYKLSSDTIKKSEQIKSIESTAKEPLLLTTPTKDKRKELFEVPDNLFNMSFDESGDLMVVILNFNEPGWDKLSYDFLQGMAKAVKKDPKSIPRSMRMFANLMKKLTPEPTGSGKNDIPRKIVINQTIEQMAPPVRDILSDRLKTIKTIDE